MKSVTKDGLLQNTELNILKTTETNAKEMGMKSAVENKTLEITEKELAKCKNERKRNRVQSTEGKCISQVIKMTIMTQMKEKICKRYRNCR